MANINRVVLVGNLTKDPELRHTPSGTAVCKLRIAVNTRQKDAQGNWGDKPNYFDVTVWGNQGESCSQYLSKGRPVGVDGRLDWREWEAQDGSKRQAVEIIADTVQFLGGLQYLEANTRHFENAFRANMLIGGFHVSPADGNLRIDAAAAAISGQLRFLGSGAER